MKKTNQNLLKFTILCCILAVCDSTLKALPIGGNNHFDNFNKSDVFSQQQQRQLQGKVTDSQGGSLPGVTVSVKGTTNGTITDNNGFYSLSNISANAIVQFSFVGMKSQEFKIVNQTTINVTLTEESIGVDEVVVVGYGTQLKKDVTGSVSSIKSETLNAFPTASLQQTLQGKMAGVSITNSSGAPGSTPNVRIRGIGSVNNNNPLWVIDGVPLGPDVSNPLQTINPTDIESVDVLKDASAAAIYGSRGNNGVIVITTKKGKAGAWSFNVDVSGGFSEISQKLDLLNAQEHAQWWVKVLDETSTNAAYLKSPEIMRLREIADSTSYQTSNWIDAAIRPKAYMNNYTFSASGGSEKSNYYLSGGYYKEEGIVENFDFKRYSLRFNSEHQLSKRFKFGNSISLARTENTNPGIGSGSTFFNLALQTPSQVIRLQDGRYANGYPYSQQTNALAEILESKGNGETNRILGSLFGEFEFLKGLKFRSQWSTDMILSRNQNWQPSFKVYSVITDAETDGSRSYQKTNLNVSNSQSFTWFGSNYFTYDLRLDDDHKFEFLLGMDSQRRTYRFDSSTGYGFESNEFPYMAYANQTGNPDENIPAPKVDGGESANSLLSYYSRINYNYKGKYLATATIRRDGSSKFGPENRFGIFPSFSLGWRISDEAFMSDFNWLDNLKLRGGYGETGGEAIPTFQYFTNVSSGDAGGISYNYVFGNQLTPGFSYVNLANRRIQWEANKQTNIGLDLGVLKSRIQLSADYFLKMSSGMLLPIQNPFEVGVDKETYGNVGEIKNSGFEITLFTDNIAGRGFKWTTDANFTTIKNEVVTLSNANADRIFGTTITRVGYPIGSYYMLNSVGIIQDYDQMAEIALPTGAKIDPKNPKTNVAPGDIYWEDFKKDSLINDADRKIVGSSLPKFTWGLTNTFSYKGITLSVLINGVHGNYIYNSVKAQLERMDQGINQSRDVLNAWTPENTNTGIPRYQRQDPNNNKRTSTRFLEKGDYVRIRNIKLSYALPRQLTDPLKLQDASIYFTGTNLFIFTKYSGFDPEINNSNPETGLNDQGQYPVTRQFNIGLNVRF
jgi:TonB-linked SusC/RagA family outer membrane protein